MERVLELNRKRGLKVNKIRELAKVFRELAELYDEMADVNENTEIDSDLKEKILEDLTGKVLVKSLKVQKLK